MYYIGVSGLDDLDSEGSDHPLTSGSLFFSSSLSSSSDELFLFELIANPSEESLLASSLAAYGALNVFSSFILDSFSLLSDFMDYS